LTYASAIDDPGRFRSSKAVGAHFGLTPKKYQSGETDVSGRISKIGDGSVRTALYEAANVILTRPVKGSTLKSWGMRLAARAGMRKAKVALAHKLAVVLHRMLADDRNSALAKRLRQKPANKRRLRIRAVRDTSRPEQGPVAGTMDQVRPMSSQQGFRYCAFLDWPTCSSSNPIKWWPSADPGQKRDPGRQGSRLRGIDHQGPVTEEMTLHRVFPGVIKGDGSADERWGAVAAGSAA
jgi:hypothetical protein